MGILNVTPDSFSDGGRFMDPEAAVEHGAQMKDEGADILDVGGESTRPATFRLNAPLDPEEEMRRVLPVIDGIARRFPALPISIDTYKAGVARRAVDAGAVMINDISAMRADVDMATTAADLAVPVCLMHMPGLPTAIPAGGDYGDVVRVVRDHLRDRAAAAVGAGIPETDIVIDPGIGFGKSVSENLEILHRLRELTGLGFPVLVGVSRKSAIGAILGNLPPDERLEGTSAAVALAIANGAAIVRVHDVLAMSRVVRVSDAIVRGQPPAE
jgi:dihydropteroate synthase